MASSVQPQPDQSHFGGELLNAVTDPYIIVSDNESSPSSAVDEVLDPNATEPMKVEQPEVSEATPSAPPPPQTLPIDPEPLPQQMPNTPKLTPPPIVRLRYTEVIDHPKFVYADFVAIFRDCIHHEMTTRLQVRVPFTTAKNRAKRFSQRVGLGLKYNIDNNIVEACYHPTRKASDRELHDQARRRRRQQHDRRAEQRAQRTDRSPRRPLPRLRPRARPSPVRSPRSPQRTPKPPSYPPPLQKDHSHRQRAEPPPPPKVREATRRIAARVQTSSKAAPSRPPPAPWLRRCPVGEHPHPALLSRKRHAPLPRPASPPRGPPGTVDSAECAAPLIVSELIYGPSRSRRQHPHAPRKPHHGDQVRSADVDMSVRPKAKIHDDASWLQSIMFTIR